MHEKGVARDVREGERGVFLDEGGGEVQSYAKLCIL